MSAAVPGTIEFDDVHGEKFLAGLIEAHVALIRQPGVSMFLSFYAPCLLVFFCLDQAIRYFHRRQQIRDVFANGLVFRVVALVRLPRASVHVVVEELIRGLVLVIRWDQSVAMKEQARLVLIVQVFQRPLQFI